MAINLPNNPAFQNVNLSNVTQAAQGMGGANTPGGGALHGYLTWDITFLENNQYVEKTDSQDTVWRFDRYNLSKPTIVSPQIIDKTKPKIVDASGNRYWIQPSGGWIPQGFRSFWESEQASEVNPTNKPLELNTDGIVDMSTGDMKDVFQKKIWALEEALEKIYRKKHVA